MATPKKRSPKRAKPQCVTTELPRFEAWPALSKADLPVVRAMWRDSKGRRCFAFILQAYGSPKCPPNEVASVCAVALARHFGGIADISRTEGEWSASFALTNPTSVVATVATDSGDEYHRFALKLADNMCGYLMQPIGGATWRQAVVEAQHIVDQLQTES